MFDVSLLAMDRRDFIKLSAIAGAGVTLASCGGPEHQIIRFVPDEDLVPGVAEWKPSVCPICQAGCGLNVRVMEADVETVRNGQAGVVGAGVAKKLEGLASHPIGRGGLCARGQAAIQITYHPDRLTQPMKRSGARGRGRFAPVSWDEAIGELAARLDALAAAGDQASLVWLARPRRSRRLELAAEFLDRFGAPAPIGFELFAEDVLRRANALSFGREQLPTFDLARARAVVAFGADFLGTWNSPVAQAAAYGEMRQGRPGVRGLLVQIESRMSPSGANADEWVPIRPATDGVLALGLAHVMMAEKLCPADAAGRAGALIEGWSTGLAGYAPDRVEQATGVPAARIGRLARELADRRPAVAIIGGAALAQTNGLFHALAVNALNALLGSVGEPGGVFFAPLGAGRAPSGGQAAIATLSAGVLLLDDVNPVYGAPKAWGVREALGRIPFIASFGSFIDDTSAYADLLLPDHSFLESWVDGVPESGAPAGVENVAAPTMKPLHDTRATPDVVIALAGRLKAPVALPWKSYDEMLKASLGDRFAAAERQGYVESRPSGGAGRGPEPGSRAPVAYAAARFDGDASAYPFYFLPYASPAFLDGTTAHLPWLQELPDPLTSAMWSSWVEINPRTAERLGIAQGDVVEVTSTQGSLRAPAMIVPGLAPDVIAMPAGQGHDVFTRFASGRGANPAAILAPVTEPETGALAWAATRVRIARAGDPDGRLILFAGELREHPHEHETR